ncbi:plastidial pyruvate kinase 2 [Lolium rigidum]|uniref:plastidial pyruvate kinase 2 n=1 Tax=Lolium rigidum TaxID=89674 RepID=UPI001F5DC433|nr:plastidial pyruvate kinase 2 [Lolium rigidum]
MAQVVAAAAGGAGAARPLGGAPGTDTLRPAARLPFGPRERWSGSVASRGRRDSPVASVISRAPRPDTDVLPVSPDDDAVLKEEENFQHLKAIQQLATAANGVWSKPNVRRKTKIVCTIGPSTNTREMIWSLAEAGMNVARLNMSHGDHASHQKVIDLVKEYNAQTKDNVIALMVDTKGPEVRSGDLPQPIFLETGQEFTFTIKRGVGTDTCVSVNYDDFVNDVEAGDMLLVDGGMMSFLVKSKTEDSVKCEVIDGGELKSRRHLNVRGKSATLPSITDKDWDDIKFGVENQVDYYAVSFVKDAQVVHELKDYLRSSNADIHVIVKIESADSIPNLHSIITASDGAMVARGDLGAELPIEEVPLLQEEIIRMCRSMGKAVIVATNMLESMIVHPTPTRAEVSDIAIAVREGADAVMLSGETAHGKFPLKAVKVMHTVALRTEATITGGETPSNLGQVFKNHMSEMFAYHSTMMSNTLGTSIVVFTRTGYMSILLSHYRPSGTIFAFTDQEIVRQRLALYQGVCPVHMEFSDCAEKTFGDACSYLLKHGMVKEGEEVALVQSGRQPIWRSQSTHNIQVRKV